MVVATEQLATSWGSAVSRSLVAGLLVGLLLGPLLNLLCFLVVAIFNVAHDQPFWTKATSSLLFMTSIGGAAFALVIGVPVSAWLSKFNRGPWAYALAGLFVPVLLFGATALFGKSNTEEALKGTAFGMLFSSGYALLFWVTINFILSRDMLRSSQHGSSPARAGRSADGGAAG